MCCDSEIEDDMYDDDSGKQFFRIYRVDALGNIVLGSLTSRNLVSLGLVW